MGVSPEGVSYHPPGTAMSSGTEGWWKIGFMACSCSDCSGNMSGRVQDDYGYKLGLARCNDGGWEDSCWEHWTQGQNVQVSLDKSIASHVFIYFE